MIVFEFKARQPTEEQAKSIDEAIRTSLFIRNKSVALWKNGTSVKRMDLQRNCKVLASQFPWARNLNSMARQAAADRGWSSIKNFYDAVKNGNNPGEHYPKFRKTGRSVEYKTTGWKLDKSCKSIRFTDGFSIGRLRILGTRPLSDFVDIIKRVRIVKRADGYYVQLSIAADRKWEKPPTGRCIGIDLGLRHFYTDSDGNRVGNPRYLSRSLKKLKARQRKLSRSKKRSNRRRKMTNKVARQHLKVSRQRRDFVVKAARALIETNDLVACEDLDVRRMVRDRSYSKGISDVGWGSFIRSLDYFASISGSTLRKVEPAYTTQMCNRCGFTAPKEPSERSHRCACGLVMDRDHNAAINILNKALHSTAGHAETTTLVDIKSSATGPSVTGCKSGG